MLAMQIKINCHQIQALSKNFYQDMIHPILEGSHSHWVPTNSRALCCNTILYLLWKEFRFNPMHDELAKSSNGHGGRHKGSGGKKKAEQLLQHHKKSLEWQTSRATMSFGANVEKVKTN
ncbi:hypothetical protein BT96DRAFT_935681 [Gymnopus androsaceus JB14]|uniref:Uncharacterized protein n=1 Tax=Gymnopus androsaceus JB14 TaxID=1447944 RepID=A0A6A4I713_9AGAR|nr:hypothetical protein BT96DRAFT_935681 [Gymnopus androsaceus JB14]